MKIAKRSLVFISLFAILIVSSGILGTVLYYKGRLKSSADVITDINQYLTFSLDFENASKPYDAVVAKGDPKATMVGSPKGISTYLKIVPNIKGKGNALFMDKGGYNAYIKYQEARNFNPAKGTMSFWFKPDGAGGKVFEQNVGVPYDNKMEIHAGAGSNTVRNFLFRL